MLLGVSHAVYITDQPQSYLAHGLLATHLVRIDLKLDPQQRRGDVVHQIRRAEFTLVPKPPAQIRIVWVSDRARSRVYDGSQVGEVLGGGCGGDDGGREDDAADKHGGEECGEFEVR